MCVGPALLWIKPGALTLIKAFRLRLGDPETPVCGRGAGMLDWIGSNYLVLALGAMLVFTAALAFVSLTDKPRT